MKSNSISITPLLMTHPLFSTTALETAPPERVAQIKYIGPCWNIKEVFHFRPPPGPVIVGILGSFCEKCVVLPMRTTGTPASGRGCLVARAGWRVPVHLPPPTTRQDVPILTSLPLFPGI